MSKKNENKNETGYVSGMILEICAFAALAVAVLGGASAAWAQPAGLVTAHGRQFALNGQAYRFVGVNLRGLSHYGQGAPLQYTSVGDIDANLDGVAAMGGKGVRLFAANKNRTTQQNIDSLRATLDKMKARNLKALICLTDLYNTDFHPAGDDAYYMIQPGGWTLLDNTWFASGYTVNYLPWVQAVVGQLKDHAAIFAWEIGNELTDIKTPLNIVPFTQNVAAAIKALDPWHMVGTGFIGIDHTQIGITQGVALYSDPNLDFISGHSYDGEDQFDNWSVYARVEKPFVLGEYGWSEGNGSRVTNTQAQLAKWFDQRLAQGFLQWGYQVGAWDIGDGDNNFGVDRYAHSDYNEMVALYSSRAAALASGSQALDPLGDPAGTNLALAAASVATSSNYSASFGGAKAIDGVVSDSSKWTSAGTAPPHWLALDLGAAKGVTGFVLRMANAAGERVDYAFKTYKIESGASMSGPWAIEFEGSNPAQYAVMRHRFSAPKNLRYVRLTVTNAGIDNYARLPEFEVIGGAPARAATGWMVYE